MADQYFELPLRSVGSISAPGIASEATQLNVLAAIEALGGDREIVEKVFFDYSADPVGPNDYVELIASTSDEIKYLTLSDTGGYPMVVGIGSAGTENELFNIPPGGFNGEIPLPIPSGSRVAIKCLVQPLNDASNPVDIVLGYVVANFLK